MSTRDDEFSGEVLDIDFEPWVLSRVYALQFQWSRERQRVLTLDDVLAELVSTSVDVYEQELESELEGPRSRVVRKS